jgi:hypothetical protein
MNSVFDHAAALLKLWLHIARHAPAPIRSLKLGGAAPPIRQGHLVEMCGQPLPGTRPFDLFREVRQSSRRATRPVHRHVAAR